jgi:hypothetical protein
MGNRLVDDWLDGFMYYSENSEPPEHFRLWTGISVIASALQRKCFLPWGSITFYPNMYIVLCAPSATRKGVAMGFGMDFLETLPIAMAAESTTRESLIRELFKSAGKAPPIDSDGKYVAHSSLTVHSQEFTVFLGSGNTELMMDLTDWYDCRKNWTYRTKHEGTDAIKGVWVNIQGATTPALIQSSLSLDAIGGGLTSRIIFVCAMRKGKHCPIPHYTREQIMMFGKLRADLEKIYMMHGDFKVNDSKDPEKNFINRWIEWYSDAERNPAF